MGGLMPANAGTVSPWLGVYLIYAAATLGVVLICMLVRLAFGASPSYLARTRCYELPPVRLVFHAAHVGIWIVFFVAVCVIVRHVWAFCTTSTGAHGLTAVAAMGVGLLTGLIGRAFFFSLIRVTDNLPPVVEVGGVVTCKGIDSDRLTNLGREQFPQMLAYGHTTGLWVRGTLMVVGFACATFVIVAATDWGRRNGIYGGGVATIRSVRSILPPIPQPWAIAAGLSAALGLVLVLFSNTAYTLLRFPTTLAATAGLAAFCWSCAAILNAHDEQLGLLGGVLSFAFAVRWANDLCRASQFTRVRNVSQPIADRLSDEVSQDLATIKSRPDCRLVPLDEDELCERITCGCRNVEEASPLVTRNLARFLSLVRIEYEQFAAATLRYLTVRRFVSTTGGGGTTRWLQHPVVPVWNESLFPLHPPVGFRNWLDPLGLGWDWDIVSICPRCGGSGRVSCSGCSGSGRQQRSETNTQYSGGQSVTRTRNYDVTCSGCGGSGRVTCPTCSGQGRVVYHQTLNTQWQRLQPTCTAPHVHIAEFLEDAEERTYYRVPLVEDRQQLATVAVHDGIRPDLRARLSRVVPALSAELPEFIRSVEQLHDGVVYRADFRVTGLWVLRISFQRLPGKVGWFFGRRPEFYFPALPLAWGSIATVLFVLPFVTMTLLFGTAIAVASFRTALPLVP